MLCALCATVSSPAPNFLVVLVDDLGWKHVGYQGGAYETPRIDRLASESMIFSRAYIPTPTCSPSRAALLTGQHPARLDIVRHIPTSPRFGFDAQGRTDREFNDWEGDPARWPSRNWLPLDAVTFAEALGPLGYRSAFFGKWHLGSEDYHPVRQGFDEQHGVSNFGHPGSYYPPYWRVGNPYPDEEPGKYLTDRLTDDVVDYLAKADEDRPFLATVFLYNVHAPHIGRKDLVHKYLERGFSDDRAQLAAMVEATDSSVGRMLDALEESGHAEDTVVIFLGDQGGLRYNEPLRGGKPGGTALYEGGARVPMLIRWPANVAEGTKQSTPVVSNDIFPTIVELAGGDPGRFAPLDGVSLEPLLTSKGGIDREALFLERHYEDQYAAVVAGDWKLVAYWSGKRELYNVTDDPSENLDIASRHPDRVRELSERLAGWRADVGLRPEPGT
jgi:arylsulfatase A-like enzyme